MIFYKSHQFDFFFSFFIKIVFGKFPSQFIFCISSLAIFCSNLIVVCRILFFKFSVQCVILSIQFFVVLRVINDFFFLSDEQ